MARTGRAVPDHKLFRETILLYDFFKDIVDDQHQSEQAGEDGEEPAQRFEDVPLHFKDEQHYIKLFLPLFFEEVKAQIHRAKTMDMSTEVEEVSRKHLQEDVQGFYKLELFHSTETKYSVNDLVLLKKSPQPLEDDGTHTLGLVDNNNPFTFSVSIKLNLASRAAQEEGTRTFSVARAIASKQTTWNVVKVMGISTMLREIEALMALPYIHLRYLIVNRHQPHKNWQNTETQAAPPVPGLTQDEDGKAEAKAVREAKQRLAISTELEEYFQKRYKATQLLAIHESRKVSGITLVQGPPGTGKTTTILGILGMLLNAKATTSTSVSYTRTSGRAKSGADAEDEASDSDGDEETDEAIAERQRQRALLLRQRAPWLNGGYVPWADTLQQELSDPSKGLRVPYPKVERSGIMPMSEIQEEERPQKVLVCAPSNAAIDEVVRRAVAEGIVNEKGKPGPPSIMRLGPNHHQALNKYSLEKLADTRAKAGSAAPTTSQIEKEKLKLLKGVRLVCTTLSSSGSRDVVDFPEDFDTVVIDEASQGVEISTLVPLKLGCRRLILVGDPQQLPATCFSSVAKKHQYERSLFERLKESDYKVSLLELQFRMHPAISEFPSSAFYDNRLHNALDRLEYESKFPAPWSKIPCFGPVVFFNISGKQRSSVQSLVNDSEADFVVQIFKMLQAVFPKEDWAKKLAVISPYAEQVKLIKLKFNEHFGLPENNRNLPVDVNTVDGFQGREKDVIIVSVVRADPKSNTIGFVRDKRRMNVAFTRARTNLWVVGHATVLRKNEDWSAFIEKQEAQCRLLRVTAPTSTFLARYLDNDWFARHPELPRPDSKLFFEAQQGASAEEMDDGEAEKMDDEEMAASDAAPMRDIEEVSDYGDAEELNDAAGEAAHAEEDPGATANDSKADAVDGKEEDDE